MKVTYEIKPAAYMQHEVWVHDLRNDEAWSVRQNCTLSEAREIAEQLNLDEQNGEAVRKFYVVKATTTYEVL